MAPIVGLDRRANPQLAAMVTDFIHERWAAKRTVAPDMWRCVGRYADARGLDDLRRVLSTGSSIERQAAALALSECQDPAARQILAEFPQRVAEVAAGMIRWDLIDECGGDFAK